MTQRILTATDVFLRAIRVDWDIDWRGQLNTGLSGFDQVVYNAMPRWVGRPQLHLHGVHLQRFAALRAHAQGRAGIWRLPLVEEDGRGPWSAATTWDGGVAWDTGTGWAYEPIVVAAAAASAGAFEILVTEGAETVQVGELVSHDDWPYRVTWREVEAGGVRLGVETPLRAAIPSGDAIQLRATGLFRLVEDTGGNPAYGRAWRSEPEIAFVEYLAPERFA